MPDVRADSHPGRRLPTSIGLRTFVALLCSSQVLIVIAAFAWTDLTIQRNTISTLGATVQRTATELDEKSLEHATQQTQIALLKHLAEISRCAEHVANHIRDAGVLQRKEGGSQPGEAAPAVHVPPEYLQSLATYFDVPYAYFGTRENIYMHALRTQRIVSEKPTTEMATNKFNGPPHFPSITDTSVLSMPLSDRGEANWSAATLYLEAYNGRMRPWYNTTRFAKKPTWIKPYLWLPELRLGTDACIPLYDDSGLPQIDEDAAPDARAEWSESLSAVGCCASSLEGLSEILASRDLGENGVAFLVEGRGEHAGLLVAAADFNRSLPVAIVLEGGGEGGASMTQRLSALRYPEQTNRLMSAVSREVLRSGRAWAAVGNEESLAFELEGVGTVGIRTAVIDGTVPGWHVDAEGLWGSEEYRLEGQHWVFVIAQPLLPVDFDQVNSGLHALRSKAIRNLLLVGAVAVVASFLLTHLALRSVSRSLKQVVHQMEEFRRTLNFGEQHAQSSKLSEVNSLLVVFNRMQRSLQILARYVPPSVPFLGSKKDSSRVNIGELNMKSEECTVMCFSFSRDEQWLIAERKRDPGQGTRDPVQNMSNGAHFSRVQQAAEQFGGELIDFTPRRLTVLFTGAEREGTERAARSSEAMHEGHADRACRAAQRVLHEEMGVHGGMQGCVGISTGVCMIGNYGTASRMKFGALGPKLEIARRLCSLAETYGRQALVGKNTVERAMRVYPEDGTNEREVVGTMRLSENHHQEDSEELPFYALPVPEPPSPQGVMDRRQTGDASLAEVASPLWSYAFPTRSPMPLEISLAPTTGVLPAAQLAADLVRMQPEDAAAEAALGQDVVVDTGREHMAVARQMAEGEGGGGGEQEDAAHRISADKRAMSMEEEEVRDAEGSGGSGRMIRGGLVLVLLCALQIVVCVLVLAFVEIPILRRSSALLNSTLHDVVDETAARILGPLTQQSIDVSIQKLSDMPKCAEMLATEFRQRRFGLLDETPDWSSMFLHSMVIYYDVLYAYYGTRGNRYMEVERRNSPDAMAAPEIFMAANMFNTPGSNLTHHTDTSLVRVRVDKYGLPVRSEIESAEYAPRFNARLRPWYQGVRLNLRATWIDPFVYVPGLFLGIDACVPIYDEDSSFPPRANNPDESPGSQWNESLEAVTCCDNSLDSLSAILSQLEVGPNGVVFIVEALGASAGLVVGAASRRKFLPTSRELKKGNVQDGHDTSAIEFERLDARTYPREFHAMIGLVSHKLLAGREWAGVGEEGTSFDTEELGRIGVRSAVLDGTVPGWFVGGNGRWNASEYRLAGMSWRLVVAVRNEDFMQILPALEENEKKINDQMGFAVLMVVILCVASVLLSALVVRMTARQLASVQRQMELVDEMQWDRTDFRLSVISEIQDLQLAFDAMREWLGQLQRYIPSHVIEALRATAAEKEVCIARGTLGMAEQPCSIITILIPGFLNLVLGADSAAISRTRSSEQGLEQMSDLLARLFEQVAENGGVVDDFEGDTITAFWRGGDLSDVHAVKACLAAEKILGEWKGVMRAHAGLQLGECFMGVHSTSCLVGNYGTPTQLKYGVSEAAVARTLLQVRIGKMIAAPILLDMNTREAVTGYFVSDFARTTELGCLYELTGLSNTFAMVSEGPELQHANSRRQTARQFGGGGSFSSKFKRERSLKRLRNIKTLSLLKDGDWDTQRSPPFGLADAGSASGHTTRGSASGHVRGSRTRSMPSAQGRKPAPGVWKSFRASTHACSSDEATPISRRSSRVSVTSRRFRFNTTGSADSIGRTSSFGEPLAPSLSSDLLADLESIDQARRIAGNSVHGTVAGSVDWSGRSGEHLTGQFGLASPDSQPRRASLAASSLPRLKRLWSRTGSAQSLRSS